MHITSIYPVIIQNKGYAPGLVLGRQGVSSVSQWWLWDLLLHEDLLLILLDHLLKLVISDACDNDATLSISATATLKIRIHMVRC